MAQFKSMLNSFSKWWYDNVSHRYEPSKHYFRGKVSNWHKEEEQK